MYQQKERIVIMTKSELIMKINEKNQHLTAKDVERIVNSILAEISLKLENGGRVEIRNFGAFDVKTRKAHVGRNPLTGESVDVPEKSVPFFKAGKLMRERLNKK